MMNNTPNAKQTKTTLQKQVIAVIVIALLLIAGLVFYYAVLPNLKQEQVGIGELYPGEATDASGTTLYMVTPIVRKDIEKIEVKNDYGLYVLNAVGTGAGKSFELEDAPGVKLDDYALSGVVIAAAQPITAPADSKHYRAHESATERDLIRYGLDEASTPNWFRVTRTDGTSYRIILGNKLATSKNCYAYVDDPDRMVDVTLEDGTVEKRYIIYVLDSTSYQTLLFPKTALVTTILGEYLGNGVYYTKEFKLYRYDNDKRDIAIHIKEAEALVTGLTQFDMVYPGGYNINEDVLTQQVLPTMASFTGDAVVELGDDVYKNHVLEKYGLDINKERIESDTDANDKFYLKSLNSEGKETEITIYISKLRVEEDGSTCYYAYAPSQQKIVRLSSETFKWLDWAFGEYVDLRMFVEYIGSLDYFSILAEDNYFSKNKTDYRFRLTGNPFNHKVYVTNADGSENHLDKNGNPFIYEVEYETGVVKPTFKGEFERFRDLYYVLITRMLDSTEEPKKIADDAECRLTVVAQTIQRDRNQQFYKHDGKDYSLDSNGRRVSVTYEGGYVVVQNLKYKNSFGTEIKADVAYYDEATNRYFVKTKESFDGMEKAKDYTYTEDNKLVPVFINAKDATAEYTTVTYEYKFYDLISTNPDTGEEYVNQTYMLVVPTETTTTWIINPDGTRTQKGEPVITENGNMGSYIHKVSVEKLVSDTYKALNGIDIDEWAVE